MQKQQLRQKRMTIPSDRLLWHKKHLEGSPDTTQLLLAAKTAFDAFKQTNNPAIKTGAEQVIFETIAKHIAYVKPEKEREIKNAMQEKNYARRIFLLSKALDYFADTLADTPSHDVACEMIPKIREIEDRNAVLLINAFNTTIHTAGTASRIEITDSGNGAKRKELLELLAESLKEIAWANSNSEATWEDKMKLAAGLF